MTLTKAERKALVTAMRHLYSSDVNQPWARVQSLFATHGISATLSPRRPHEKKFGWPRTVYVYAGQLEVVGFFRDTTDPFPDFCVRHFIHERPSWRNLWSPSPVEVGERDDGPWWDAVRSLTILIEERLAEYRALAAREAEIRKEDSALRARKEEEKRVARLRRAYKE